MAKLAKTSSNFTRKRLLFIFIAIFFIILTLIGAYRWLDSLPRSLGPQLEYVGHIEHCALWAMPFCAQPVFGFSYYFATDMSEKDLKDYFKNALFSEADSLSQATTTSNELYFKNFAKKEAFSINFYFDPETISEYKKRFKTNKTYIIKISDSEYMAAKAAL